VVGCGLYFLVMRRFSSIGSFLRPPVGWAKHSQSGAPHLCLATQGWYRIHASLHPPSTPSHVGQLRLPTLLGLPRAVEGPFKPELVGGEGHAELGRRHGAGEVEVRRLGVLRVALQPLPAIGVLYLLGLGVALGPRGAEGRGGGGRVRAKGVGA
jgi:hypothetical protein